MAENINDDILTEIFDACRTDCISPNTYPNYWWYRLAHVCQKWRRVAFASPIRLGLALICTPLTPVADLLAHSPPLPLIVYWGNITYRELDERIDNFRLALKQTDRVCRIKLQLSGTSLRTLMPHLGRPFPVLETLELYYSSPHGRPMQLPFNFQAPNLRHLYLSECNMYRKPSTSFANLSTFFLGEITSLNSEELAQCLSFMPNLKRLNLGFYFPVEQRVKFLSDSEQEEPESLSKLVTNLEELQYEGDIAYLEALAAQISAPRLKKLSIAFSNVPTDNTLSHFSQLISGAADLSFYYARVRFKDYISIVMDHNELWTGRGAFELRFDVNHQAEDLQPELELVGQVLRALVPMPSTVQSLLVEYARSKRVPKTARATWHEILRLFDNVKTLRVAHLFVDELDSALGPQPDDPLSVNTLMPRLQEIVRYGSGYENKFAAFAEARQLAGLPVHVVSGPENRLMFV
ncbi:hypothetical protein BC827DRAFT_1158661 [Russula dissimulans]|nr:hypothetical protein BC827DRAFT_1158661 [Russula dissimulans]